ncbi:MAG: TRAM domain-containing protein, partial [Chloroflexota bacterium]|nr:TRAM domain-containing protein [Chloroflexota bacterium]
MAELWPDEVEIEVASIAQGGHGVGRWHGRPVFATGALPGETVRVRLRERQASFARGEVVAVSIAALERVPSPCPLERLCGAADWRWVDYSAQLRFKAAILEDQLRHLGGIEIEVSTVHGMVDPSSAGPSVPAGPGWGYRTTAELHVSHGKLGYFAPNSRRVVDLPRCCLHHPSINDALETIRTLGGAELSLR